MEGYVFQHGGEERTKIKNGYKGFQAELNSSQVRYVGFISKGVNVREETSFRIYLRRDSKT